MAFKPKRYNLEYLAKGLSKAPTWNRPMIHQVTVSEEHTIWCTTCCDENIMHRAFSRWLRKRQ